MKGGTIALAVGLPVVLGGGGLATYLLLRRKPALAAPQDVANAQFAFGNKAVATGAPVAMTEPTKKIYGQGTLADPRIMQAAGNIVDKFYPGMGSTAAGIVSKVDQTIGTGLFRKIPGVGSLGSKLKLW